MKSETDLLREAIENEFTLELKPLIENFVNDFNSNIRIFYLEAKEKYELIQNEDADRERKEQTAFKNLLKQQYTSQSFKDFFNDLSLGGYTLDDKIINLYADERTIGSFLIQKKTIKGSPCDFFSVCLGIKGWKNFKPNNIPKRIKISEQYTQEKIEGSKDLVEKQKLIISGATIINEVFIEDIKKQEFTMAEFYTAKQNEDCQWYGIIQGWDIQRDVYGDVKSIVENCFEKKESDKVSVLIHGEGGIGKSLFLRKIAYSLCFNKSFIILWLNDFDLFYNGDSHNNSHSGWNIIKNNNSINYLLFIEDWQSMVENNTTLEFKKFLENTRKIKNIRIIIGDRYVYGKEYIYHLNNEENKFELKSSENKKIILKIIDKVPIWKVHIKEILSERLENAPLYMLLFIIAKTHESKELLNLNLSSPENAFKEIIRDDIQQLIHLRYSGFAKALYYWSFIYSEYRLSLTYSSLLLLAKHYSSEYDKNVEDLCNLGLNSQITKILNNYIGIRIENNHQIFYFNHDIISDSGFTKISFKNWGSFDDLVLKCILIFMIEKGDKNIASKLFFYLDKNKPVLFKDNLEKLKYINKLIQRETKHYNFTNSLLYINLTSDELESFANRLWKINNFAPIFWCNFINNTPLKVKWCVEILTYDNIFMLPKEIISTYCKCAKNIGCNKILQDVCAKILEHYDILNLSKELIATAINYYEHNEHNQLARLVSQKIIMDYDSINRNKEIVSVALRFLESIDDRELVFDFCAKILSHPNMLISIEPQVISSVMKFSYNSFNDEILQSTCKKILSYPNVLESIDSVVILNALKFSTNTKLKKRVYNEILNYPYIEKISPNIMFIALNYGENESIVCACKKILAYPNAINNINSDVFCRILILSNDLIPSEVKKIYFQVLTHSNVLAEISVDIICTVLNLSSKLEEFDEFLQTFFMKLLNGNNVLKFKERIIFASFNLCKDKNLLENFAKIIISNFNNKKITSKSVLRAMKVFENLEIVPEPVVKVIQEIICSNKESAIPNMNYMYLGILRIAFHSVAEWEKKTNEILNNWEKEDNRIYISNVLYSYKKKYAERIRITCERILINWRHECIQESIFNREPLLNNHFTISLGHPQLKSLGVQVAHEIHDSIYKESLIIPNYIKEIIEDIIDSGLPPQWYKQEP